MRKINRFLFFKNNIAYKALLFKSNKIWHFNIYTLKPDKVYFNCINARIEIKRKIGQDGEIPGIFRQFFQQWK